MQPRLAASGPSLLGGVGVRVREEALQEIIRLVLGMSLLKKAHETVYCDRQEQHGDPVATMAHAARVFNAIDGAETMTARKMCLALEAVKIARREHNPDHEDNTIDLMGYAELAHLCRKAEA